MKRYRHARRVLLAACVALLAAGCASRPVAPRAGLPGRLDAAYLAQLDTAMRDAIAARKMPGAVLHVERDGAVYERAYGRLDFDNDARAVDAGTLFDAASLSKVLATAPAVLQLAEEGRLDLDARLVAYFPECAGGGKEAITIRHLLSHSSGLPAGLPAAPDWHGDARAHELACGQRTTHAPGTVFRYSDVNYVLLGQLVRQVSGMPLDAYARTRIFEPLKMADTGFLPLRRAGGAAAGAIAPTRQEPAGVVHDPTARRMDGVAGSAGVFSTARDLARYARMLLRGGELDGVRVLSEDSVRLLTTAQSPAGIEAVRGLGMDIASPYAVRPRGAIFPIGSYGHTGYTGCVLWIDPGSRTFYVLLSNRVYPDDRSKVLELYARLGTLAALAAGLPAPPGAPAPTGD